MIKIQVLVKRRKGMSVIDFRNYWLNQHGPLVQKHASAKKYIRKYIQSHTLDLEYESAEPDYDGVAELWFESAESCRAFYSDPLYLQDIQPDEYEFAELSECRFFMCKEYPVL